MILFKRVEFTLDLLFEHPNIALQLILIFPHSRALYHELRDMLIRINRRRKLSKTAIEQFGPSQWRTLVRRELQTEDWFMVDEEETEPTEFPLS